jgi:membrane protease YdiL (CAAX protease family)
MVVYGVAFFVWGLGSALIYRWQRRLMPLIIAHFLVNLMSTLPALILPFILQGAP